MKPPLVTILGLTLPVCVAWFFLAAAAFAQSDKLTIPHLSPQQSIQEFDARRLRLLENLAGHDATGPLIADPKKDVYGDQAIANLALGRFTKEANERLRAAAEWFERPHPRGREHNQECDFQALRLCRAYHLFRDPGTADKLEPATRTKIEQFFLVHDFNSIYTSENHVLLFHTSRYLMAQALPDATFQAYNKTGKQLLAEDGAWLRTYIEYRARQGWGEFDATGYMVTNWGSLTNLYDYCADPELKLRAQMMLDLMLADIAVDSLHGLHGGAHGRTKNNHVLDHAIGGTYILQYLHFGDIDPATVAKRTAEIDALATTYRAPPIIVDLALDRADTYVNLERKHLHNVDDPLPEKPLDGSIRKYTYWTPDFILGCVQKQDDYPETLKGKWYAHHEQQEWDLTIGARTRSRLFTHHPGQGGTGTHGYWVGDTRCNCGHFFQSQGALIALYDIPPAEPLQLIHAYLPKNEFDEIKERDGFVFLREGNVCAALKLLQGYEWTSEGQWKDKELISKGNKHAVVCEAAKLSDVGSFQTFQDDILANAIQFDPNAMSLVYHSKRYGELRMNTKRLRELNGKPIDLDYPTYGSPYMHSPWDSGIIEITKNKQRLLLDFRAGKRTLKDDF